MGIEERKKEAALHALGYLPLAGTIGLGTGSTARHFIDAVGDLVRSGRRLVGVPTSEDSRARAKAARIPCLDDDGPWSIDVVVDGADEVSRELDLIKGGGGALTREKIVNDAARQRITIVDQSKLSPLLGEKWVVPVEVLRFGHASTAKRLSAFGEITPRLRSGAPLVTDGGNLVYDVRTGPIPSPGTLEREMLAIPGVVEVGLFVGRADIVIVAGEEGITELRRSNND